MALTKADLKARKKAELEKEQAEFEEKKEKEKIYKEKKVASETKPKTETKPKVENQTEVTPKKTANNAAGKAQQFSTIANKPAYFSAKAISSEAEKKPMSATQYGKTQLSNQIYDKYRTIEKYYNDPTGNSLEKGLVNRLRSAGGETVENIARFIDDNISDNPEERIFNSKVADFLNTNAKNVVAKNTAGQIGDLADQQIMQAKENTGNFGDFLIDTADAGANMASQAILAGVLLPGAPTPVANKVFSGVQGVSAGAQKYVDTREAGGSKAEALQRGIGSGAIATITEGLTGIGKTGVSKIPGVDKVVTHLDEFATKNWLTNVLSTGLGEGGEEGLEYAFEYASDVIADLIYKGEIETDFNVAELFQNVASGFVLGAGFAGVGGTTNAYQNYTPKTETNVSTEAPVTPAEPPVIETENVTPEVQNEQESTFANAGENGETKNAPEINESERNIKYNNVNYNDTATKTSIMQNTHNDMLQKGQIVVVDENVLNKVSESYPDMRNVKKKDRVSILKEKMKSLKTDLRKFLSGIKGTYDFDIDGDVIEATLYDTGINEVLEKVTQNKANMLYASKNIFQNAQYLYSTPDYEGNPNIDRWNYFYTPVQIGDDVVGVRIAVRDIKKTNESQIYNWGIKKDATLGAVSGGNIPGQYPASSVASNNYIPQDETVVNTGDGGFGENTVGAAQSNPASYSYMQNNYDVYPEGENVTRIVDVPISTNGENRVNRFARTEMEAGATPDSLIPNFEKAVENGIFSYDVASDKGAMEYAKNKILNSGFDKAVGDFEGLVEGDKRLSKNDLVVGEMLYAQAAQSGDAKIAMELASALAQEFTKAGQAVQAARILKKLTPEGRLYNAQKIVDRFNSNTKKSERQKDISIDEKLATELLGAQTEAEIEKAEEAIKQNIADQIVSTKMDKWNAWRYLSMLGNPKTHIRNVLGNAMFVPARVFKNVVKAGIEKVYSGINKNYQRTTTVARATNAQKQAAKESFEKNAKQLASGGNYRFESEIESKQTVFKNKILEGLRKANNTALEAEDMFFLKRAYEDSFAKYLRANNIDPKTATEKQISAAENYAQNEAWKATYRDASKVASAFEKFSKTNKVTKVVSDALLPFRKTPINILARGIEYSPVELVKAVTYDAAKVKKGEIEPQEMIDHIASGLTGSGVVALGAWLASMGLISGGDDEDDKVQNFEELQGKQNYALQIGDYSYTLDWATPISMPLFVGVEVYKALAGKGFDSGDVFNATLDAVSKTADPMIGLSMLQNVESILSGTYGGNGNGIANLIKEAATSYVLQAFPTLGFQIAQTIDPVRRNAYYTDKTNDIPDVLEIPLNRILAKIPGASQLLPERVDEWGRTEKQEENVALRIFENFASPGYISKNKTTEVDEMLKQLYADTGESSILPKNFAKSFNVDGENLNLSGKQYVDAQKKKGQTAYNMLEQLIADKDFKKLSSEQKASIVSDVYSYANVKGKQEVSNYTTDTKWYKNIEEAKSKHGISNADYLIAQNHYSNLDGDDKKIKMLDQLVADKGTSAKQDVALMEYIAGVDMSKYKKATSEPSKQLALYKIKNDENKGKENDLEQIQKEFKEDVYGAKEIYYKSEGDWSYNIDDVIDNGKNRDKKVPVYKKFGLSEEDIVNGYNATIGYNKKEDLMAALTDAFGSKKKATTFYNILKGKKGYK